MKWSGSRVRSTDVAAASAKRKRTERERSAREQALRLLARREHGRRELATKLASRGFPTTEIEQALTELQEQGWLDDVRAARHYARELFESRGFGRTRVIQMLQARGFSEAEIRSGIEEFDRADLEEARAWKAAERFRQVGRKRPDAFVRHLERLGFGPRVIVAVLGRAGLEEAMAWSRRARRRSTSEDG